MEPGTPGRNPANGELSAGAVPGFYLSSAVEDLPEGTPIGQVGAMIEPGDAIDLPGVGAGARVVSSEGSDSYVEPMLRYRTFLDSDRRFAASAVGYAAHAEGSERGASYEATRAGLELSADARLTPISNWFELHVVATLGLLGVFADGRYCLDAAGEHGIDCPEPPATPVLTDAEVNAVFPAAAGGLALDIARHLDSAFHGGRITVMGGGGTMPRVVGGEHTGNQFYGSLGLTAMIAFGAL